MEDVDVDGRIIIIWIFRKWDVGLWPGSICLRVGTGSGLCDCGNEPSISIICLELLD